MRFVPLAQEVFLALGIVVLISTSLLTINWLFWKPVMGSSTVIDKSTLSAYGVSSVSVYCRDECVIASYVSGNGFAGGSLPRKYLVYPGRPVTIPINAGSGKFMVSPLKCKGTEYPSPGTCMVILNPSIKWRVLTGLVIGALLLSIYVVLRVKRFLSGAGR